MKENNKLMLIVVVLVLIFLLPWKRVNWGKVRWMQSETVTVIGEAKSVQKNQIATFNAGVDAINSDKDKAVAEVNSKMEAIIKAVKDFGIVEADIKTQNLNIFQQEETYYEGGVQKNRKGQWRVNNGIEIVLREVDKASSLASLLTSSGANNVYGPNFSFDDVSETQKGLYEAAMKDAREKAEMLVKVSGRKLGKVINVSEGGSGDVYSKYQVMMEDFGGRGVSMEPGSGTVRQSLVVVFELE